MGQLELVSRFADGHYSNRSYSAGGYKMLKIRNLLVVFGMLFYSVAYADVQVSIGICRYILNSSWFLGTQFIMRHSWNRITFFTMAYIGFFRKITGTKVLGTTALGG